MRHGFNVLGKSDLTEDGRFSSPGKRSRNRDILNGIIENILKDHTQEEWIQKLNDAGVPCGPILSVDQVFDNQQVKHLGLAKSVEHPTLGTIQVLGPAVTLNRTPASIRLSLIHI